MNGARRVRPSALAAALAWLLSTAPTAAAHGAGSPIGLPGWLLLIGSVLGLWIVVGGAVVLVDGLLRGVLGPR